MAGEELLHGGLFDVALLGDEPVQPAQQSIHIAQRLSDGALFAQIWGVKLLAIDVELKFLCNTRSLKGRLSSLFPKSAAI